MLSSSLTVFSLISPDLFLHFSYTKREVGIVFTVRENVARPTSTSSSSVSHFPNPSLVEVGTETLTLNFFALFPAVSNNTQARGGDTDKINKALINFPCT